MIPANNSQRLLENSKMLVLGQSQEQQIQHEKFGDLINHLQKGDVLVMNSSATLPASFRGKLETGQEVELRLAAFRGSQNGSFSKWAAISFGEGDWRWPTEKRGLPPTLSVGDRVEISKSLSAEITSVDKKHPRLLEIEFHSPTLIKDLYTSGKPIQYSYLEKDLEVWDQQSIFATSPLSVEAPSASFPFTWEQVLKLKAKGVEIIPLLHSAGISSSGDETLDSILPLKEYYEISQTHWSLITKAKQAGHQIVAVGTSVVRALESAALYQRLSGYTSLVLSSDYSPEIVDALITGMHETGTSHAKLMEAFCGPELVRKIESEANEKYYRSHEYGDITFIKKLKTSM